MKKSALLVAAVAMIALIYFICSRPGEKAEKNESPIISQVTSPAERAPGTGGDYYHEEYGYEEEGARPRDTGPLQKNTLTYRLEREATPFVYTAMGGFNKITASEEMTGYVVNCSISRGGVDVSDTAKISHVISILLPTDVTPDTFTERSSPFIVQFFGPEAGILYTLDRDSPFSLTIEEWGGPGGRARGYFSGTLKSEMTSGKVLIHDGRFDVSIN